MTVNITLSTGLDPTGTIVTFNGIIDTITSSNTLVYDIGTPGSVQITAFKIGYEFYSTGPIYSNCGEVFNVMLSEKKYPPTCLEVDSLTLKATWCEPLRTALDEDFESPEFPPVGWQATSHGEGWFRTNDGSGGNWTVPEWDSYFAMTFSGNNGCCDYLITPAVDLRESDGYVLSFDSYYDGAFGELAFIEYSLDGGNTWLVLCQLSPDDEWIRREIDLGAFGGPDGPEQILFAFRANSAGGWASGWAIDNVKIQVPGPPADYLDFWFYVNDSFVGVTTSSTWDYSPLMYGQSFTASVAARYSSGLSSKDYYTFNCKYLFPPDSLTGIIPDDAAILQWYPPWEYWPPISQSGERGKMPPGATRDVGDVILSFPAPSPISQCWGICDDGQNLWITDPALSATNIYKVTYGGINTGTMLSVNFGQSWIGDMVSDGEFLYGCLVGGPNAIVKVDIATGETVETITGEWAAESQQALAADFINDELYIGGWNSNQIWRTDFSGATLSTHPFNDVTGLAWQPMGGVNEEGSLWVVEYSPDDIVTELDPANNWATIQSFTLPDGQEFSGAGAEIKLFNPDGGNIWLTNVSNNHVYLVDLDEPCCPPPYSGQLPENLLGYNIYRDGAFVAYTPHVPPGEYVPQGYVDQDLWPGHYEYTVTAVYDLTAYGYSGDTAESMPEGPVEVTGGSYFDLDFLETWSMGTFEDNNWIVDSANWSVNNQVGNPSPAAEFNGNPVITGYEASLTSYPLGAVGMTEGKIWLDFDLKLDAFEPTGEELIQVDIWNWESTVWSTVAVYSNAGGSFDWTLEHINIKSQAMGKIFRVRFLARGSNSASIQEWFIDNIHVYRECEGPTNLQAFIIDGDGIGLSWDWGQSDTINEWIHWDDGVHSDNSFGSGGQDQWDVAARWEPAQLANFEGASVTEISFFPLEPSALYKVRVWVGPNAANLVLDQAVSPVCGQWNTITLNTPVPVDVTQDLWIGYHINTPGGFPAGGDDGPAIDGYGNMINFGGWQTLLQMNPDLDYNWNISAHLMTVAGVSIPLGKSNRELSGINIYRKIDDGYYSLIDFMTEDIYYEDDDSLIPGTTYCYMVSAVFFSETDMCESALSNEACVLYTGLEDLLSEKSHIELYPNPAKDYVMISSSDHIKTISVFDGSGRIIKDEKVQGKEYLLTTNELATGIYLVRVETQAGIFTSKLTIFQ